MQGQIAAIEAEANEVYGEEINEDIMRILVGDFTFPQLKKGKGLLENFLYYFSKAYNTGLILESESEEISMSGTEVFYRSIGLAIEDNSGGKLQFIATPGKGNPMQSSSKRPSSLRFSPSSDSENPESLKRALLDAVNSIPWMSLGRQSEESENNFIPPGMPGAASGKYPTLWIDLDRKIASGESLKKATSSAGIEYTRKQAEDMFRRLSSGRLKESIPLVLIAKSAENKLLTGQGLGDLFEFAIAEAISGTDYFDLATASSRNKKNWDKSGPQMRDYFKRIYDFMVTKTKDAMRTAASEGADFGSKPYDMDDPNRPVDIPTESAYIHAKYDAKHDMTRLAGIQPGSSTNEETQEIQIRGRSTSMWREAKLAFLPAFGHDVKSNNIGGKKQVEWLYDNGFYDFLENGTIPPTADPSVAAVLSSKAPTPGSFLAALLEDILREFVDQLGEKGVYYFTYFPSLDGEEQGLDNDDGARVKIEKFVGNEVAELRNELEIVRHPNYGPKRATRVYQVIHKGKVYLEIEGRGGTGHPLQIHRGEDFSSEGSQLIRTIASSKIFFGQTINENYLPHIVREILEEQVSEGKVKLIVEELTGADKSEIKRMIAKEIEGASNKRATQKVFQAEFNKELKRALGTSFIGEPGKINKFVKDSIRKEIESMFKDKETQNQIGDITKAVMKKLYRELSFSSAQVIDRIKM